MSYLAEHPGSKDTLDGIMEWWLLERKIICQTKRVKEALAELIENGLVLEHKNRNSQISYSINQSKYGDILSFINQMSDN
jgi:hypothetical protein